MTLAPILAVAVYVGITEWPSGDAATPTAATPCQTALRVVSPASFAPVLQALAPELDRAAECVRLEVTVADGRTAAQRVAALAAHVWIADDPAWTGLAPNLRLAEEPERALLATSPVLLVGDQATIQRLTAAGGTWLALADLAARPDGVRLVVHDPAGSADGLVAAGAVGEAVWLDRGMDASAQALSAALPHTRTVPGVALPGADGEIGLIPEYALPHALADHGDHLVAYAPTDHTAQLRYTWMPTADAVADPVTAAAARRTLDALRGEQATIQLEAAGLRAPDGDAPSTATSAGLPAVTAAPFDVLAPHHVEHVFATWYLADRRSDLLVVIDVSGSMAAPAAGSDRPLIDLVREGTNNLGTLLPDDSQLAVWEFGSQLDPPLDHRVLLPRAPLGPQHRTALATVTAAMTAERTGTGLHDTLLAAYTSARDGYRDGVPNHVLLFTDGRNEDDPGSITAEALTAALAAAADPARPVQLTVVTFGPEPDADLLSTILEPVDGYVDPITTAAEVGAVFIHLAAGGLHH